MVYVQKHGISMVYDIKIIVVGYVVCKSFTTMCNLKRIQMDKKKTSDLH